MNRISRRVGLGDAAEKVIHAALNVIPMPAATRTAIKGCSSCRARKERLNRIWSRARS
jgi:hypothetical protein